MSGKKVNSNLGGANVEAMTVFEDDDDTNDFSILGECSLSFANLFFDGLMVSLETGGLREGSLLVVSPLLFVQLFDFLVLQRGF